jgi:solute carrier family 25 aspartate/glutamate transporter 12/13
MLRGLQGECIRQAFHLFDKDGDGFIESNDSQRIIAGTTKYKLSYHLLNNLHTLCNTSANSKSSYAIVRAFHNMIREMDLGELIIQQAADKSEDGKITQTGFLNEATRIARFSLFTTWAGQY